jgi:hypothetical protein
MNWASSYRPEKDQMRRLSLAVASPKQVALFLPGWDSENDEGCFDVKQALELGVIDRDTQILAVERNLELVPKIAACLKRMEFNKPPIIHAGQLSMFRNLPQNIDLAVFDLLGNLDDDMVDWFKREFCPRIAPGADITFTFTLQWRYNRLMKDCKRVFFDNRTEDTRKLLFKLWSDLGIDEHRGGPKVILQLAMLKCLFHKFSWTYKKAQIYRDSRRTMCLYRLGNLQKADTKWPSLDGLLGRKEGGIIMATKQGTKSAQKAWATRHANARAKVLSERALKAWATRRKANAKPHVSLATKEEKKRAKMLSQRALKAWETRRAAQI